MTELAKPDPHWGGTGALKLPYDWRDFQAFRHPEIAEMLPSFPDSFSLREFQKGSALDQDGKGACVATSSCHMQAFYEQMERNQWITFDWDKLYTENGGTGPNGVPTRQVLQDMQENGCPVLNTSNRYKISSYAFVDFGNFDFAIQTVKAAIAAKRPLVLALLLPSDFGAGMNAGSSSSKVTSGYHQMMVGEYTSTRINFFNSWGPGFGDHGWCSVPVDYLARPEQRGFLYAYTTFDAKDTDPIPPPPPPPPIDKVIVDGDIIKAGSRKIVVRPDKNIMVDITGHKVLAVVDDKTFEANVTGYAPDRIILKQPRIIDTTNFVGKLIHFETL